MRRRAEPVPHTVSAVLGIVVALLVGGSLGLSWGYLTSAEVGGLTAGGLGYLAGLAFVAAAGAYIVEESNWRHGFLGRQSRRKGE
jgi:hypothetical protein